jgi:hypothetical protein
MTGREFRRLRRVAQIVARRMAWEEGRPWGVYAGEFGCLAHPVGSAAAAGLTGRPLFIADPPRVLRGEGHDR